MRKLLSRPVSPTEAHFGFACSTHLGLQGGYGRELHPIRLSGPVEISAGAT